MTADFNPPAFTALPDGDFRLYLAAWYLRLEGFEGLSVDGMWPPGIWEWFMRCADFWVRSMESLNADSIYRGFTGHPGGCIGDWRWLEDRYEDGRPGRL